MEIIFLAAGLGRRMRHLTDSLPKPLVAIDGRQSILAINIENLRFSFPESRVILVGGYQWEKISEFAQNQSGNMDVTAVFNAAYDTRGPLDSVNVGLVAATASRLIIANGDTLFSEELFCAISLEVDVGATLVVSPEVSPEDDDMRVSFDEHGRIRSARKQPSVTQAVILSAGCLILSGSEVIQKFKIALLNALEKEKKFGRPLAWHCLIEELYELGEEVRPLYIDREHWQEFDSPECIENFINRKRAPTTQF